MENILTEVQSICIFLMGTLSIVLKFFLPRHLKYNGIFCTARKILTCGTVLVTIHFIIQYILHKNIEDVAMYRTLTNLIFGFPISYCFFLSIFYLHRRGDLRRWMWLTDPILALIAYTTAAMIYNIDASLLPKAILIMAALYAIELIFNVVMLIHSYMHILKLNRYSADDSYILLIKWTKWYTLIMIGIGLGFPIMTFNPNVLMRSIYGILAILAAFFYILSFIGYGFAQKVYSEKNLPEEVDINDILKETDANTNNLSSKKQKQMEEAIELFEKERFYLKSEITIKEMASLLGISVNMLRIWLRTSEYEKFNNWIIIYRIEYAKSLLVDAPEMTSEEIAEKCGFCDRQYFQKIFTKHVGISPFQWKQTNMQ